MSKTAVRPFQVGDKVRIVRQAEFHYGSPSYWDPEMDDFVGNGEVYVVQSVNYGGEPDAVELGTSLTDRDKEGVYCWVWPVGALKLVEDEAA